MAARQHVTSEVGRLHEVIVHRPGLELRRLTRANKTELLFDELVWVTRAQEEHDAFTAVLRTEGVRVLYFADLLVEAVDDAAVREELVAATATVHTCGVELADRVRGFLLELSPQELVTHLLGGLTVAEVPGAGDGFVGGVLGPAAFLVPPLPNSVFTRDPSAWIGDKVVLAPMHKPARQAERRLWGVVYRRHPVFAGAQTWYGAQAHDYFPATLEGGDILVLSSDCVAIGLSQRSHPVAVENLAAQLFTHGGAKWVLAIDLPKERGTMHLDTVLTIVDTDAVVMWPRVPELLTAYRIEPGHFGRMRVTELADVAAGLAQGLGVDALRVLRTGQDAVLADREQWDDGNNTLAVRPGVVVAYERNVDTNARMRDAGIQVLTVPSSELPRGRGGPRCMSCPVLRDPI